MYWPTYLYIAVLVRCLISVTSSEARASRNHFFCLFFFWSPDFHELLHSMMSLFTEVKRQCAPLVLGWVTALVHYSCLALVDRNSFQPCSQSKLLCFGI